MRIITITGVSGSGKTTLQNGLREMGWSKPINFTTREPRHDGELDEYVFLTKEQFKTKLENGDFLEHTEFKDNFYGISVHFPKTEKGLAVVVEPNGREQIREFAEAHSLLFTAYYIYISEEEQARRLSIRGGNWRERLGDASLIQPSADGQDVILNGMLSEEALVDIVEGYEQ